MIKCVTVYGAIAMNAYFFIDETTNHGFLIDPGWEAEKLIATVRDSGWVIEKILLTHGHFDHIGAAAAVSSALSAPIYIHTDGIKYLTNPYWNLSAAAGDDFTVEGAMTFADGDVITLKAPSSLSLRVIHTPGHTEDSCLLYSESAGIAFSGDTIFQDAVGVTHFPGGNEAVLRQSVIGKVFALPPETVLYPGHGFSTSVAAEMPAIGVKPTARGDFCS